MTTLQFADTHNLVAFLTKSAESEGFEQIVDFLNASSIRYALTVNPTIYTSCIEQFWSTVKAKMVNGEVQLQALVDGKKIVVTEASVRRDLQLEDANGVDCLPNAIIFEQLTLMGAKTTAWNEFSSTMASAIICLATNQKFNFSKYIFESMVKNLDNAVKFLMYPRFVQVFLNNQLEGMATHNRIYIAPSHTKKIFANMRRQGKDFSRRETPLFPTMVVQAQEEMGEGSAIPTDPQHTPTITQPSSSQPQKKHKSRKFKMKDTQIPQSSVPSENLADEAVNEENVSKHSNDPLLSGEDRLKLDELMALCTNLQNRVLDLEHTKTTQALEIDSLKRRVKKLEKKQRSKTHGLKRLYKVGLSARVVSSEDEGLGEEDASKQGRKIHDNDADEDITLENVYDEDVFGVNDLDGDEVVVESEVADKDVNLSVDEVTLAQALAALKSAKVQEKGDVIKEPSVPVSAASTKVSTVIPTTVATTITAVSSRPRAKGIVFHEQEQEQEQAPTPIVSSQQPSQIKVQDKGKGKMNEPEPVKKLSKNDQLRLDEELAFRLQAEEEEEERLAREKAQQIEEANTAWDDIQAKVEADYQLAQRLHDEEQEQYTDEEKAKFFCEFLDQRRKFFAAKRAEAKRNKPPTQAQQRKFSKKGENEKESSSKRTGEELESDKSKKQKLDEKVEAEVDDVKEAEELKQCLEIILDDGDDVTIDATPLSVKIPIMLKNFDREDLEVLWRIVKARFKKTEPVNYMDTFLHLNLKTMFELSLEISG
ncbi:hypothetical protein Tco_1013562 [Tanacetum coccineum]